MRAVIYTGKNYKTRYLGKVIDDGINRITLVIVDKKGSTCIRSFNKSKNIVKVFKD